MITINVSLSHTDHVYGKVWDCFVTNMPSYFPVFNHLYGCTTAQLNSYISEIVTCATENNILVYFK